MLRLRRSRSLLLSSALGLITILVILVVRPIIEEAELPDKPGAQCAENVKFFAYESPEGTNQFGPNQDLPDVASATARLQYKLCSDPLFAATTLLYLRDGMDMATKEAEELAASYVADAAAWLAGVESINAQNITFTVESLDHVGYESLGMVRGSSPDKMPGLRKRVWEYELGDVLIAHMPDGTERWFRIACDLQPSEPQFPNVPFEPEPEPEEPEPEKPEPEKPEPTQPPVVETCTPVALPDDNYEYTDETRCYYRKKLQSFNRQQNVGPAVQESQNNTTAESNGVNTGSTAHAPTTAPKPSPVIPAPAANTPAPTPPPGGADSGGGSGSAPVGTATDSGGTTSGEDNSGTGEIDDTHSGDDNSGDDQPPPPPG